MLLILWGSRITSLESLPLHNDEGLHLTRAVEVWHGHPFWEISDGKIINHWLIALLYPQTAPVFVGRIATILVSMLGLAASVMFTRKLYGQAAALLVGGFWIASPYLFFFERTAFSDSSAGALAILTTAASYRLARTGQRRDAILTGLCISAATLFKFTAAPYALAVLLIVLLLGQRSWREKFLQLVMIGLVGAACFSVPMLYLFLKGEDFSIALGWISGTGGNQESRGINYNLRMLWDQLTGYDPILWTVFMLSGMVLLAVMAYQRRTLRRDSVLIAAGLLPMLLMIVLATEVKSRHYVVGVPLALTLGGAGWGTMLTTLRPRFQWIGVGVIGLALLAQMVPFAHTAYTAPEDLKLPDDQRLEHITQHSAGYGLREAVEAFPQTIGTPGVPVIGSMFPDSCRRANFYDTHDYNMLCTDAPGIPAIQAALDHTGVVYVLAESQPIGFDPEQLQAVVERIAIYPRPGGTTEITLWRLRTEENAAASPSS
jgi:hypothetical protein